MERATQVLTYDDAVKAAREYYEAGKLTAQHPDRNMRGCFFYLPDDESYRCAVGAALTEETRALVGHTGTVNSLLYRGVMVPDSDLSNVFELQRKHDDWATRGAAFGDDDEATKDAKRSFERLIGVGA